jgi:hypothetical protein
MRLRSTVEAVDLLMNLYALRGFSGRRMAHAAFALT